MKRALFLLLFLMANDVFGVLKEWIGLTNTDWNTGTNWIGGSVPANNDDISIIAGSSNFHILFNSTPAGSSFTAGSFINAQTGASLTILPTYSFTISAGTFILDNFTFELQNATIPSGFSTTLNIGASTINTGKVLNYSFTNPGAGGNASLLNFNDADVISGLGAVHITTAPTSLARVTIANNITISVTTINAVNAGDTFVLSNAGSNLTFTSQALTVGKGNSSIAGQITGPGSVTYNSSGDTLTLSRPNPYTGTTTITAGTVALSLSGSIASSASVPIAAAGIFDISQISSSGTSINTLSGAGTIRLGSKALTIVQGTNQTFSGTIQDGGIGGGTGGSLIKDGSATLTLSGANTYTGGTTILAGTLSVSSDGNLGGSSGPLTISGGTLGVTSSFTLSASRTVTTTSSSSGIDVSSGQTFTIGQAIGGAGAITKTGAGTLVFSGNNSYNGTTISGGTLSVSSDANLGTPTGALTLSGGTLAVTGSFTLSPSRIVTVPISSTIDVASGQTFTIGQSISGAGGITKTNGGTLIFGGSNSYNGTTISGGILSVSSDANLGTASGALTLSGGTLQTTGSFTLSPSRAVSTTSASSGIDVTNGQTFTIGQGITGAGAITKSGAGTLVLGGTNTYSGDTTVQAGTLTVTGSIASATTTIQSGATLRGTGTLQSVIAQNGATIAPGTSSIGTLHVSSVTFNAGSIFQVEIDPSHASLLDVSGLATLAGTVNVIVDAGTYPSRNEYLILQAGAIAGSFTGVTSNNPAFPFTLRQTANQVFLSYLISIAGTTNGTLTGNRKKIATFLNENGSGSALMLLTVLNKKDLKKALNRISPARNVYGTYISQQTALFLSKVLTVHIDNYRFAKEAVAVEVEVEVENFTDAPLLAKGTRAKFKTHEICTNEFDTDEEKNKTPELCTDESDTDHVDTGRDEENETLELCTEEFDTDYVDTCCEENRGFWISGFGQYAHQQQSHQNPAFSLTSESGLIGYDYRGPDKILAGFAAGYAHTHFFEDENAGHGNIQYYYACIYANGNIDNFYISPAVWGLFNKTDQKRNTSFTGFEATAQAEVFAWQITPHLEIGYSIERCHLTIAPFTALDWPISWQRRYHEHGAFPFNAVQPAIRSSLVRSETGLKFSQEWELDFAIFSLKEKGSYVFEKPFGIGTVHTAFVGTPGSFTLTALNQTLHLGAVGLNFLFAVGENRSTTLDLDFEAEFGPHYWSNEAILTLTRVF